MTEPDYYPLAMAAEKTGYTKEHLVCLAAEDKLSFYARLGGVEAIEIEQLSDHDPDDVYVEPFYLTGLCKIPVSTIQQYQNDRLTVLHGFTLPEGVTGFYYNLKKAVPMKEIALLISSGDVARLSKKETVKPVSIEVSKDIRGREMADLSGYVSYLKAKKILDDRLKTTEDEIALWVSGVSGFRLDAYMIGLSGLIPFSANGSNPFGGEDYISPLEELYFLPDDIERFQPAERFISWDALIERWEKYYRGVSGVNYPVRAYCLT